MLGNWHCLDEEQDEEIELYGNINSASTMTLRINLMLCNPTEVTCDENFNPESFLEDKWITILSNERMFNKSAPVGE